MYLLPRPLPPTLPQGHCRERESTPLSQHALLQPAAAIYNIQLISRRVCARQSATATLANPNTPSSLPHTHARMQLRQMETQSRNRRAEEVRTKDVFLFFLSLSWTRVAVTVDHPLRIGDGAQIRRYQTERRRRQRWRRPRERPSQTSHWLRGP